MTIRRLRFIAFAGFLLLVVASVVVTLWALRAQQDDAVVINLAGRQRMLIQQMALETLGVQIGMDPVYRQSLEQTADSFEQTLNALAYGGEVSYTDGTSVTLSPTPAHEVKILAQLETVRATWNEMHPAIHAVLQNDPQSTAFAEAETTVERLAPVLLAQMDLAVRLYEIEATRKVAFVQAIQFSFLGAATLLLLVAFVITERRILMPIARLGESARRIGTGDLGTPVSVIGLDELDWLARSLDEMRRRLGTSTEAQVALLGLSRRLLAAQDEHDVSEYTVEVAASALHTEFSALVLPDVEGRLLTNAVRGWPPDFAGRFELGQGDASQTGYTIVHNQPIAVENYSTEAAFAVPPAVFEYGVVSGLSVPMLLEGRVVGAILVHSRTRRRFGDNEIQLLSLIANQTAVALEKVRLFKAEARQAQEAETLRQAGTVVAATLHQEEAIERILEQLARVVSYDSASVQLLGDSYLEIVGGRGWPDAATVVGLRFPVPGDNPNTIVIQKRRPHILADAPVEYAAFREDPHSHIHSWLGVPLIVGERIIGMLSVDNVQPDFFTTDHARLAAAFANQVGIAIENARLYAETERKASELGRLYAAARDMASTLDPHVVLEELALHLTQALGATSGYINAVDAEQGVITVLAEYWSEIAGPAERASDLGRNYTLHDYPLTVKAIANGKAITCGVDSDLLSILEREELLEYGIQTEMLIPIITRGQSIGVAQIWDSRRRRDFTEAERLLAQTLAQHGAGIIQNAHLYAETEKHAEQLRALREVGHALTSDLRLEVVLPTLIENTRRLVGASYAALAVLDEEGSLSQFHTAGITEAQRQKIGEHPKGLGLLGALIREGAPIRIPDIARDARSIGFPPHHPPMKTFMGVPIVAHGKVMGSLYLTEKMSGQIFTQDDEDLVVGLAADAAIAIENARLFGKVEQQAITDSLTGLHNRRHFLELAEHEFQRARRYRRPVSMIMLDIDHFKKVNDTYSHAIGDQVLRAVAAHCRESLRNVDFMGRFGGEEFIVLLPESDMRSACIAAERLRQSVANNPVDTDKGPIAITISLGVARQDENTPNLETLIARVDQAMYVAKHKGRNRVATNL